jgi:microcompartment protein CcmL/EutN
VAKRAPVELLLCEATTPGKYLVLFAGGVAEVDESLAAGAAVAADALLDRLFLPQAHAQLLPAIRAGTNGLPRVAAEGTAWAAGMVELTTVSAALRAADAACKAAEVELQILRLARGIGGKGFFILRGELHSVEAALEAAKEAAGAGTLAGAEIVAAPHEDLRGRAL